MTINGSLFSPALITCHRKMFRISLSLIFRRYWVISCFNFIFLKINFSSGWESVYTVGDENVRPVGHVDANNPRCRVGIGGRGQGAWGRTACAQQCRIAGAGVERERRCRGRRDREMKWRRDRGSGAGEPKRLSPIQTATREEHPIRIRWARPVDGPLHLFSATKRCIAFNFTSSFIHSMHALSSGAVHICSPPPSPCIH